MKQKSFDFMLFSLIIGLLGIGMLMIFSASSYSAMYYFGDKFHFFSRQAIYGVVGLLAMLVISRIDYHKIAVFSPLLIFISMVMLALVLIPGIGRELNGSRRWFNLGIATFQPSEFMKLALVLFLSFSLSRRNDKLDSMWKGTVPYLVVVLLIDFLLYKEPHMSAVLLITAVSVIILLCAGARLWHFFLLSVPLVSLGVFLIFQQSYRVERWTTFLDPFSDPTDKGFQTVNSLFAIGSGSWFGKGLGQSMQKNLYIPEPQNDFIFSILAEELGFIGAVSVILLFLLLIWRGIRIAMNAPDLLGSLISVGITSLVAVQMLVNVAVVTNSVPNTGIPLPFFSAGGTSLTFMMAGMGFLLNVSRQLVPRYRFASDGTELGRGQMRIRAHKRPVQRTVLERPTADRIVTSRDAAARSPLPRGNEQSVTQKRRNKPGSRNGRTR